MHLRGLPSCILSKKISKCTDNDLVDSEHSAMILLEYYSLRPITTSVV
jgi:hypothetical protein